MREDNAHFICKLDLLDWLHGNCFDFRVNHIKSASYRVSLSISLFVCSYLLGRIVSYPSFSLILSAFLLSTELGFYKATNSGRIMLPGTPMSVVAQ